MSSASSGSRAPSTTTSSGAAAAPPAARTQADGSRPKATPIGMSAASPVGERAPVVDVDVPVHVGDAGQPDRVAHARERARHERAAAAEHERALAGGDRVAHRRAHGDGGGEHALDADHAGLRVARLAADADVEVAAVGRAEPGEQARVAQRRGRVLGPALPAHRVDRHADRGPARLRHGSSPVSLSSTIRLPSAWRSAARPHDLAPVGPAQQRVRGREARELLEVLDRREDEQQLARAAGGERASGAHQPTSTISAAVGARLLAGGRGGDEEVRVEAGEQLARGDPAAEGDERAGVGQRHAGLLGHLPHGRRAVVGVAADRPRRRGTPTPRP